MTETYVDERLEEAEYHLSKATEGIHALSIFERGVINALMGIGYGVVAMVEVMREGRMSPEEELGVIKELLDMEKP